MPSLVGAATTATAFAASCSVARPSGLSAGHVVAIFAATETVDPPDWSVDGFDLIAGANDASGTVFAQGCLVGTGFGSGSDFVLTTGHSGDVWHEVVCVALDGVTTDVLVGALAADDTPDDSELIVPGITTTVDDAWALIYGRQQFRQMQSPTDPATTLLGVANALHVRYMVQATAGATGPVAWPTEDAGQTAMARMFGFQPAGSAPPATTAWWGHRV